MVDKQQWSCVHSVHYLRRILKVVSSPSLIVFCTSFTSLSLIDSGVEFSSCGLFFLLYSFLSVLPLVCTFLFLFLPSIFAFPPTYLFIYFSFPSFVYFFLISHLFSALFIFSVYFLLFCYFFFIYWLPSLFLFCFILSFSPSFHSFFS
jgi:hypothetical protein